MIILYPCIKSCLDQINVYQRNKTQDGYVSTKKTYKTDDKSAKIFEENHETRIDNENENQKSQAPENKDILNTTAGSMFQTNEKDIMAQFNKTSSLTDQMKIVRKWWNEMNNTGRIELPLKTVASFMTKKGITPDREKAKNVIYKAQLGREKRQTVTIDEFNRIFCKGIFKDALVNVVETIDADEKINNEDLPLSIKINQYQRGLMKDGLMKETSRYEDGKAILEALNALKREEDPSYQMSEMELRAFIEDPFGKKMQEREAAMRSQKHNPLMRRFDDTFIDAIQIMERPDKNELSSQNFANKYYSAGIDESVDNTFYKEKFDHLQKDFEELKKQSVNKRDQYSSLDKRPKRPTLMGVATKIIRNLERNREETPRLVPIRNINPAVRIPEVYYSSDRQSRLGEYSDLLNRFQRVVMR